LELFFLSVTWLKGLGSSPMILKGDDNA
jgi:hypothetical protein